jgi:hypothetical protein
MAVYRILDKLYATRQLLRELIEKTLDRGLRTEELEERSQDLLDSSDLFEKKVIPWYKRAIRCIFFCPAWWARGWI